MIKEPKFKIGDIVNVKYNDTSTLTNVTITDIMIHLWKNGQKIGYRVIYKNSKYESVGIHVDVPSCFMLEENVSLFEKKET